MRKHIQEYKMTSSFLLEDDLIFGDYKTNSNLRTKIEGPNFDDYGGKCFFLNGSPFYAHLSQLIQFFKPLCGGGVVI